MTTRRASGVLLHVTSLPSKYGIGDFGPAGQKFVDFLARAAQSYWQMLPVNCTGSRYPYSPYSCISAFAGNTLMVSPDLLYKDGLLRKTDLDEVPAFAARPDHRRVISWKCKLLARAFDRFTGRPKPAEYEQFCQDHRRWLNNYALFAALHDHFHKRWWIHWPSELRDRDRDALNRAQRQFSDAIEAKKFAQFLFFQQYNSLKKYARQRRVRIIGDIPIYVAADSADVWAHPDIFKLTAAKKPKFVAGVPPDHFSKTGQLWGNPVYDWDVLRRRGYSWWLWRIEHDLDMFDIVRLDHFRAFAAYWQVPATHKNAAKGKWIAGPGKGFFSRLLRQVPAKSLIAEDLGHITDDVTELMERFDIAGMKLMQYAFGGDPADNSHSLANHTRNCVVYTGTHDNNTAVGWFEKEATGRQKEQLSECLEHRCHPAGIHWELIRLAMSSPAWLAIIPAQDILGLGPEGRMNHPGTIRGNWSWRLGPGQLNTQASGQLAKLTRACRRA